MQRGASVSQIVIAQVFVVAALVRIFVHRWVTNRWIRAYVARYRRLPKRDWYEKADRDPAIETWRRRRLAALIPTIALFAIAVALLVTSKPA